MEAVSSQVNNWSFFLATMYVLSSYQCYFMALQELKRFPTLQSDIAAAATEALEKFRDESRKTVLRLVDMESSYLTVEFFRKLSEQPERSASDKNASDKNAPDRNAPPPGPQNPERFSDHHFRRIGMHCFVIEHAILIMLYCIWLKYSRSSKIWFVQLGPLCIFFFLIYLFVYFLKKKNNLLLSKVSTKRDGLELHHHVFKRSIFF